MKPTISAVINTLDEARNIGHALRSLRPWVDQLVVVDMHSRDATREIAAAHGAEVFLHEPLGFADPARAYAISKCHGEWIMILDADELVPPALSRRLCELAQRADVDVVSIPRINYLLGVPLAHTGWGPNRDRSERFFRRGKLVTSGDIHRFLHAVPGAQRYTLAFDGTAAIVHFNYIDLAHFIDKLNRYTSIEAKQALERGEPPRMLGSLRRAGHELYRRYVLFGGYKDGWRGFYLSLAMAFYRLATSAKQFELAEQGDREHTLAAYERVAESILAGYPSARELSAE